MSEFFFSSDTKTRHLLKLGCIFLTNLSFSLASCFVLSELGKFYFVSKFVFWTLVSFHYFFSELVERPINYSESQEKSTNMRNYNGHDKILLENLLGTI